MGSSSNLKRRGVVTGNGADKKLVLGFKPGKVIIHNVTDRISAEKLDTMAGDKALNRDATGVGTFVDLITLNSDGFTIKAALNVSAKVLHWYAEEAKND